MESDSDEESGEGETSDSKEHNGNVNYSVKKPRKAAIVAQHKLNESNSRQSPASKHAKSIRKRNSPVIKSNDDEAGEPRKETIHIKRRKLVVSDEE